MVVAWVQVAWSPMRSLAFSLLVITDGEAYWSNEGCLTRFSRLICLEKQ